jgi:type II secretory pathway pseudopilin PulG
VNRARRSAFTLVEVVLAILIISGIMTVLLYFYHRAAMVRQAALEEAEFLSTTRMFMEQISSELRTAQVVADQFIGLEGSSNAITFVCTSVPQMARWIVSTNETIALPPTTDLKRVSYRLAGTANVLAPRGLDRKEELLLGNAFTSGTNATEFLDVGDTNAANVLAEGVGGMTNQFVAARRPLTDKIQHLQFRYWAGTNWVDSWGGLDLPLGVEVTVAKDPITEETVGTEAGGAGTAGVVADDGVEVFRRVIYLPLSDHPENAVPTGEEEVLL